MASYISCNHVLLINFNDGQLNLESAIRQHNVRVITKKDEPYRIVVRRESLLEDGLAEIWKKPHNRPLQVTIRDEPGIDQGGVRREFFNLVLRKVSLSSALMDGEANRRVLRHNAIAVQVCYCLYGPIHVMFSN